MICKNCGMEIADGSRFCTNCGTPTAQEPAPVQPMGGSVPPQPIQGEVPVQPMQGEVPVQPMSGEVPVQPMGGEVPVQPMQGEVPMQPMSGEVPAQPMGGEVPTQPLQGGYAPQQPTMNGMPFNNGMEAVKKNKKPLIFAGVALVAIILVVVVAVNMFSNMGYKGVLNKLEKAVNNRDAKLAMECYPDFYFDDDTDDEDVMDKIGFGNDIIEDIDIDFEVISDKEVTDDDCSLSYDDSTWEEYITDYYEDHCDDYDGEEVSEVIEAKVKMEIDSDSDAADALLNGLLNTSKVKMIFAKVDGSWYYFTTRS